MVEKFQHVEMEVDVLPTYLLMKENNQKKISLRTKVWNFQAN